MGFNTNNIDQRSNTMGSGRRTHGNNETLQKPPVPGGFFVWHKQNKIVKWMIYHADPLSAIL
jgi:hypothetical protein